MAENDTTNNTAAAAASAAAESTWSPTSFIPEPYDFEETFVQRNAITKAVSFLSVMGSAYIIYSMLINSKRRKKLDRTFDRMLLSLSVADFMSSTSIFLGSWAVRKTPPIGLEEVYGGPGHWDEVFPNAMGNTLTCTVQGYFMYVGTCASVLFTGCIAISFLLQVKFRFRKQKMRTAERYFFGVSMAFPLLSSLIILADRGFNPIRQGFCFVNIDPFVCNPNNGLLQEESIQNYCDNYPDIRGKNTTLIYTLLCAAPVVLVLLIVITCLGMLFWSVRTQELRAAQWSSAAASGRDQKRVFIKSMLYIGAFMVVWLPSLIILFVHVPPTVDHYIADFFAPIQGVLNALIYSNLFSAFKEVTASVESSIRNSLRYSLRSSWIGRKFEYSTAFATADAGLKSSSTSTNNTEMEESAAIGTDRKEPAAVATEP